MFEVCLVNCEGVVACSGICLDLLDVIDGLVDIRKWGADGMEEGLEICCPDIYQAINHIQQAQSREL